MAWYVILLLVVWFGIGAVGACTLGRVLKTAPPDWFLVLAFFFWPVVLVDIFIIIIDGKKYNFYD